MIRVLFFFLFLGVVLLEPVSGQSAREDLRIPGEIIVWLEEDVMAPAWLSQKASVASLGNLRFAKRLGIRHNFNLFYFDEDWTDPQKVLDWVRSQEEVQLAQLSYLVEERGQPNDPEYGFQWGMEMIGANRVWDITTGGITANGDTIVVAVMDAGGFDPNHPDLADNIWHNRAEILGDSIDNDGNGYIDDDIGWDYFSDSPQIAFGAHGLSVTGIIGARGNNGLGVTGVNWQVKVMQFSFIAVPDLVSAYEYVIDQRARYNESNGAEGAFVVATNSSFGQGRVFCDLQPAWAAMFDLMGEVGILTGAATDNFSYDVEILGDMPTTCTSDFMIATCNVEEDDVLTQTSAFGEVSIDLASPGEGTHTIRPSASYGTFGKNSAAAPHLTGTIALMYSLPCESLASEALAQPEATALFIRQAILGGVDPNDSVEGKTVTGGRLNAFGSLEIVQEACANTAGELAIAKAYPNPTSDLLQIEYQTPDFGDYDIEVFNPLGQLIYRDRVTSPRFGERSFSITVSNWPVGVYFLRFGRGDNVEALPFMVYR